MLENKAQQELEQWKKKYYSSLEELEQKEQQANELEGQLRKTLSQLSLTIDGFDSKLDKLLDKLRAEIRSGRKISYLAQTIEQINEAGQSLQAQHRTLLQQQKPHQLLHQLLERLPLPQEIQKQARHLKKQLADKAAIQNTPLLTEAFTKLLGDALSQTPSSEPPTNPPGLLGKLFGKNSAAEPNTPNGVAEAPSHREVPGDDRYPLLEQLLTTIRLPEPLQSPLSQLKQRIKSKADIPQIIGELAQLINQAGKLQAKQSAGGEQHNAGDIREVLLQLLERINLPEQFAGELDQIRRQITDDFDPSAINQILEALASLISQSQSLSASEKRDLEGFLKQITDTLSEIDSHLRGAQGHQQAAIDNNHRLDAAVQNQVQEIQDSVRNATNLADLKDAVQQRLEKIRDHLKDFRSDGTQRDQLIEKTIGELINKVTHLESESEQLKNHLHQQRERALRDPLTGIHNRQAYNDHLAHQYGRWKREKHPLTMVVWDIDHFKRVNDEYGHQAGDKALKIVAKMLQSRLRESDYVARYGGEEFVALMPGTHAEDALKVADEIRHSIEQSPFHYNNLEVPVTISCGLAQFREGDIPDEVFKRADQALYLAKRRGRNRCQTERDLEDSAG